MRNLLAGVIFSLAWIVSDLNAAFRPILRPVPDLPNSVHRYMTATPMAGGWIAGVADGLVTQQADRWNLIRSPTPGEITVVQPIGSGVVVAGQGFAFVYDGHRWSSLNLDDVFTYGESNGSEALLVGQRAIYVIQSDKSVREIASNPSNGNSIVHRVGQDVIVFSGKAPAQLWNGDALVPAGPKYAWGNQLEVISVQELRQGEIFVASSKGLLRFRRGQSEEVAASRRKELFGKGIVGAFEFGDQVLVATYFGGLELLDAKTGVTTWTMSAGEIGNVCFVRQYAGGVLAGTSAGLYVMPDPEQYRLQELPKGDVLFGGVFGGHVVAGLTTATIDVQTGNELYPKAAVTMLEMRDGRVARGGIAEVTVGDDTVHIQGRDVLGLSQLNDGRLVALETQQLLFLDPSKKPTAITEIDLHATANSVAAIPTGGILIGASEGAIRVGNDGMILERWGHGKYRVKAVGSKVYIFTAAGEVFDEEKNKVASLPGMEVLDAERFAGKLTLLARSADGIAWVIAQDTATQTWSTLDIPLSANASALAVAGKRLYTIGSDGVVEALRPPALEFPSLAVKPFENGSSIARLEMKDLAPSISTVDLAFPAPRLDPWANPVYSIRRAGADWENVSSKTRASINNLEWGTNTVHIRSSWGAQQAETSLQINRRWPWWVRAPALIAYVMAVLGGIWISVRFRTRALVRRAERLEKTVEERTKELRQAQKAREEFFSTVSHEIRNPLNGVVGLCEMLHAVPSTEIGPKHRSTVTTLKECANQLRNILDDVLDFTRIDRGTIQINDEIFELNEAVEGSARAIDPTLSRCTLTLPPSGGWVRGDKGKLKQIVTNLVSNAIKYGTPDHAYVTCELLYRSPEVAQATVVVRNTGSTIPADELNSIFEGFVRAKDAVQRRIPGSGIGLAVSRRMARALGGDLVVRSEKGVTEFTATVRLVPSQAVVSSADERLPVPITAKALAIEDEKYNRMVLAWYLAELGYEVDWAESGAQAIERIKEDAYDIILTDIMLPDTTGDVLVRELLRLAPPPKPPVIAVTAFSTPEKIKQATDAGVSAFVTKPISREKLEAAIMGARTHGTISGLFDSTVEVGHDFAAFLKMKDGRGMLMQYSEALISGWSDLGSKCVDTTADPKEVSKLVHAFRSRILASHAIDIAEQLALLEDSVGESRTEDSARLIAIIGPMVAELAKAAKAAAFERVTAS